jgi:hypothetical protein
VVVERHCLDAERGTQPAHRQRLEAIAIGEFQRAAEDHLAAQGAGGH